MANDSERPEWATTRGQQLSIAQEAEDISTIPKRTT